MTKPTASSRRQFLRYSAAGGLSLAFTFGKTRLLAQTAIEVGALADASVESWSPNVFVSLAPSGALTIMAHRSEMGTGIRTTLPMVLADEMDADWDQVIIQQGDADRRFGSQNTDGSRSIRNHMDNVRRAGAMARQMLIAAAAQMWSVPAAECRTENHAVIHDKSKRKAGFGDLAELAAKQQVPEAGSLVLKKPEQWKYIGKGKPMYDLQDIVHGKAKFGLDVRLPGMKVDVIERSPVLGGKAQKWNEDAALKVNGVEQVIHLPEAAEPYAFRALGGVAVIANNTWAAMQGRKQLSVQWDDGKHKVFDSDKQRDELLKSVKEPGNVVRESGDVDAEFAKGGKRIRATYDLPHLAHAPMETPCAVAVVSDSSAEVWMPTQTPQSAQQTVAGALGLRPDQVTIHVTLLGGGFGRKSKPDYGVEAALLAREVGAPVQVLWTREDEIRHGYFHADAAMHFEATVGEEGLPTAMLMRSTFTPIGYTFNPQARNGSADELGLGFTDVPFNVPNLRLENGAIEPHLRIGWLRSVCNVFHAFGSNCFADEMARAARREPVRFMLDLIGEPRHLDLAAEGAQYGNYGSSLDEYPIDTGRLSEVLKTVGEMAGVYKRPSFALEAAPPPPPIDELDQNRDLSGYGVAVHRSFLGYVGVVAHVTITPAGVLTIDKVDVAADCGLAVNPDRVIAQMEGSVLFGISLAKYGKITAKDGRVLESNFHDYPIARTVDAPRELNVKIIRSDQPPTGVGEVGVPPVAPALLNAICAATGQRIRSLPISKHDLSFDPDAR